MTTEPTYRMATSLALVALDPHREVLREYAMSDFAAGDYAGFAERTRSRYRYWRESPTGAYLVALAEIYLAEREHDHGMRGERLDEVEELLNSSRDAWDELLEENDFEGRDKTLLATSIEVALAWVLRLRGDREGARARVHERLRLVRRSALGRERSQLRCPCLHLLRWAERDGDHEEARRLHDEFDEVLPGWRSEPDFAAVLEGGVRVSDTELPVAPATAQVSV